MQMINGAPLAANGRVAVDLAASASSYLAARAYSSAGALCCNAFNAAPTAWNAGFSFVAHRLRIADVGVGSLPLAIWIQELPVSGLTGELVCSSNAPIARYVHGWPVAANGAVCIVEGAPVVNAFTNGFDTGYD